MPQPPLFVVTAGIDQGRRFECKTPVTGIGRDQTNKICLLDTEVSRRHARFVQNDTGFRIIDLNSANGTYVNGTSINESELFSGDRLQIGQTTLLFSMPTDHSDLADKISMISRRETREPSQIIHSIDHGQGSRFLNDPTHAGSPWLTQALTNLDILFQTVREVSRTLDIHQLLSTILNLIFQTVKADRGCVLLHNETTNDFSPCCVQFRDGVDTRTTINISQTIIDHVLKTGEGVLTSDALGDFSPSQSILQSGIREAICVPMQGRHNLVGLIYLDVNTPAQASTPSHQDRLTEEHLKLLIAIALVAAMAVEDTRYYKAMVQSEKLAAVGQTIAHLSHHIKNILQGIRGGSYLIDIGLKEHDELKMRQGWNTVEKNQDKIYDMVMDMLSFSTERQPALAPSQLNTIIQDVIELTQPRAEKCNTAITFSPDNALPEGLFDPDGMHRAILNLITNAIDAVESKDSGQIDITTKYLSIKTPLMEVIISDDGIGIPESRLETIFTPFASDKGARGTGLGLPVSKKIVEEHGGSISVTSTDKEGATFILQIPVKPT